MKSFWETALGKFVYGRSTGTYSADVLSRERARNVFESVTGARYECEPESDTVKIAMDGREYTFDVPLGALPEIAQGASVDIVKAMTRIVGLKDVSYRFKSDPDGAELPLRPWNGDTHADDIQAHLMVMEKQLESPYF